MSAHSARSILPMRTEGTENFIERIYREGSQFQWVRETYFNAIQADATRIEFGIEWQAVESQGVFRRVIADNGCGMTGEELVAFFNTFGGGGKPIGGAHENFGVGSKTSLLPWNRYGMVVISWKGGLASMIWVTVEPETGKYGLKLEECLGQNGEVTLDEVYAPYDDELHGCDWAKVKPEWIEDHGTVIVLLGNGPNIDTVEGDPDRSESDIKGISSFLNRRIWELPIGVAVHVDELRHMDRALWPTSKRIAFPDSRENWSDKRINKRGIEGARYYVEYKTDRKFDGGRLGAHDTVVLRDGTEVDWYLWEGERPKVHSYAAISGYIGVLYGPKADEQELYDVTAHHSTYRSFGVSDNAVRSRLWLIIRPKIEPDGKRGVYPKTDRNSLLIRGGPKAGEPLPINDWAADFADQLPAEIVSALRNSRGGSSGTITDERWRERLAEKFGARWRIARLIARRNGSKGVDPITGAPRVRSVRSPHSESGTESQGGHELRTSVRGGNASQIPQVGASVGVVAAELAQDEGGVPAYEFKREDNFGKGMMAAWQAKHPDHPEGAVLLNIDHPVLRGVIEYWQMQYADHFAESIEQDVLKVYGEVAVSKVAHSEHLKRTIPSQIVEEYFRSEESLTMSLLGLMAEDQLISTRIGGKYSKKRGAHRPTAPR